MIASCFTWRLLICYLLMSTSCLKTVYGQTQTQAQFIEKVKAVYAGKDGAKLSDIFYSKGGSTEDLEIFGGWIEKNKAKKWEFEVSMKEFSEYQPTGEFPAPINGRKRVALVKPTHWVFVFCKPLEKDDSGFNFTMQFRLGCAFIDGNWQVVGSKFADEPGKK